MPSRSYHRRLPSLPCSARRTVSIDFHGTTDVRNIDQSMSIFGVTRATLWNCIIAWVQEVGWTIECVWGGECMLLMQCKYLRRSLFYEPGPFFTMLQPYFCLKFVWFEYLSLMMRFWGRAVRMRWDYITTDLETHDLLILLFRKLVRCMFCFVLVVVFAEDST
jgi:hypothetical protein